MHRGNGLVETQTGNGSLPLRRSGRKRNIARSGHSRRSCASGIFSVEFVRLTRPSPPCVVAAQLAR